MSSKLIFLFGISLILLSCSNSVNQSARNVEIEKLQEEINTLKDTIMQQDSTHKKHWITSLTFQDNNAENAMNFYVDLFKNSRIIEVKRWGQNAPMEEGRIMQAIFELDGNLFMCSDSPPSHEWGFTPAVSSFIECENEEEMEIIFSAFAAKGDVAMPIDNYGFSKKFGWVIDQFGVSWQLNLN